MVTTRGRDAGSASELFTTYTDRLYKPDGTRTAVLYFTGSNGNDRDFIDVDLSGNQIAPIVAHAGAPFYSAQFGSPPFEWGNDVAIARLASAWTNAKVVLGCATSRVFVAGVSKGATAALNFAAANLGLIAGLILMVPGLDIQQVYDLDTLGLRASIASAYGGGRPDDAHTPARHPELFAGIPKIIFYASDDPVIDPAGVGAFARASLATQLVAMGPVGHTAGAVDPVAVARFIGRYA